MLAARGYNSCLDYSSYDYTNYKQNENLSSLIHSNPTHLKLGKQAAKL